VKIGRERLTQSTDAAEIAELRDKAPDMKETMEIGCEEDKNWINQWPQESDVPGFKQTMLDFFRVRSMIHPFWQPTDSNRFAMKPTAS
jgi:hypothetical protein